MQGAEEQVQEDYQGWSLRQRLQLLAFEAELARLPQPLISALWEAIDVSGESGRTRSSSRPLRRP